MSTTTKERPILFAAEMVRAILAGTKTQTRRVVKPQPPCGTNGASPMTSRTGSFECRETGSWKWLRFAPMKEGESNGELSSHAELLSTGRCPFGVPGDRLWVREAWSIVTGSYVPHLEYRADGQERVWDLDEFPPEFPKADDWRPGKWRPSIHMPRWASRITLEITGVRVERLRDITEADAMAEGVAPYRCPAADALMNAVGGGMKPCPYTSGFANLWNSIAKPGETWDANPWVWVVEFKQINGGAK